MPAPSIIVLAPEGLEREALLRDLGPRQDLTATAELPRSLDGSALVWVHRAPWEDAAAPDRGVLDRLRSFVEGGGGLLLSGPAAAWLAPLGFEREPPRLRVRPWQGPLRPEDRLGLAPMPGHPLFERFPGGVYLRRPRAGDPVGGAGWWDGERPADGELIAVEKVYLGLEPHTGLLAEHRVGRGLVLSAGAHLVFHDDDPADPCREARLRFAGDLLDRLAAGAGEERGPVWRRLPWTAPLAAGPPLEVAPEDLFERPPAEDLDEVLHAGKPGKQAFAALVDARGLFALFREPGGLHELWSPPVRWLCGWRLGAAAAGGRPVPAGAGELTVRARSIERRRGPLRERWRLLDEGLGLSLELEGSEDTELSFDLAFDARLHWPYPKGALGPLVLRPLAGGFALAEPTYGGCFVLAVEGAAVPWRWPARQSSRRAVHARARLSLPAGRRLRLVLRAGWCEEAVLGRAPAPPRPGARRPAVLETGDPRWDRALRALTVKARDFELQLPPEAPGAGGLGGLVAGFGLTRPGWNEARPGYAWWFGRDGLWCLRAFLPLGFAPASAAHLRLLAATQGPRGEIAHEITPAGTVHHDAADATPMFLEGLWRYHLWTGERGLLEELWPAVRRAAAWLEEADRDGDGLAENEGNGHGWLEGGPLTDGVLVETYFAAAQAAGWRAAAAIADLLGHAGPAAACDAKAREVRARLEGAFYDEERGRCAHALTAAGTFDWTPSVLALVPFLSPGADPERAARALAPAFSARACAPWGQRMLPEDDPRYDPRSYQCGSAWPLFTGWAALADFRAGRPLQGWFRLRGLIERVAEGAPAVLEEVFAGDRPRAIGVCPQQAWSHAAVLGPFVEGLLGLEADFAGGERLHFVPRLPDDLDRAAFEGIHWRGLVLSGRVERVPGGFELELAAEGEGSGHAALGVFAPAPAQGGAAFVEDERGERRLPLERRPMPEGDLFALPDLELGGGRRLRVRFEVTTPLLFAACAAPGLRLLARRREPGGGVRLLLEGEPGRRRLPLRRAPADLPVAGAETSGDALELRFEGSGPSTREVRLFAAAEAPAEARGRPARPPARKVLHLVHGYPPEFVGGTEAYVQRLVEVQRADGWRPVVVAGTNRRGVGDPPVLLEEGFEGVRVLRIRKPGLFHERWDHLPSPAVEGLLAEVLRREAPDVVHVHHWQRLASGLVRLTRRLGIPVVVHLHDLFTTCPRAFRVKPGEAFCRLPLGPESCRDCAPAESWMGRRDRDARIARFQAAASADLAAADLLFAPSKAHAEVLRAHLAPEAAARLEVLEHGALHLPARKERRRGAGPLVFAHWGHLQEIKGLRVLAEALRGLGAPERWRLELWGEAVEPEFALELEKLFAGLPVHRRRRFARRDLSGLEADLAIFPTLAHESWSFVLDEAFALGLPVVGSERGALPERIGAGGAVFPAGDAEALRAVLARVLADPSLLDEWRRALPAPRSMEEHWRDLRSRYLEVAGRRREAPAVEEVDEMVNLVEWEEFARVLEDRCRELDGLKEKALAEKAALERAYAELLESVKQHRARIEDQERDLMEHRRLLAELRASVEDYERERRELRADLEAHRRRLAEVEADLENHRAELAKARDERARVEDWLREAHARAEALARELAALGAENRRLTDELAARAATLADRERELAARAGRIEALERERADLHARLADAERRLRRFRRVHLILWPLTWPLNRLLDLGNAVKLRLQR